MPLRPSALVLAIALLTLSPIPARSTGADPGAPARHTSSGGRILVTFGAGASPEAMRSAHEAVEGRLRRRLSPIRTDVVSVDDVNRAVAAYRAMPGVASAEPDAKVHALSPPPDNAYPNQWNFQPPGSQNRGTINWEPVYPAQQGAGVIVAIVDTGLRSGGTDAPAVVRTDIDYDFASNPDDADADDENGHGTHIAGTIAQRTGNATTTIGPSVAGIAPAAQILPVKVLDRFGEGTVSDTAAGVLYAAAQGAKVINLSLGGNYSKPLCDAVASASRTAIVIAASGNEAEEGFVPVSYPGACPTVVGIGALRYDGSRAPYSNAGCEIAATAPGGDQGRGRLFPRPSPQTEDPRNGILQEAWEPSLNRFGFFFDSGTSMAAAHAAGAAAVLLAINPDIGVVKRVLLGATRDLGKSGSDDEYGSGALDLNLAVSTLQAGSVPAPREAIGYWMVATDGGIFAFGDAGFLGSTGNLRLNSPIVGMARTVTGLGYWLVAADGGIFAFGDAQFYGSTGNLQLSKPIVGMAATATGEGYWLVASDGGIFAFGDARFFGSTGGLSLRSPIIAMATNRTGQGYWMVASDGGIFAFGDAPYRGSMGGTQLNAPVVGMSATPTGDGYWMVASDGGIFAFGDAGFFGSTGDIKLNKPIVGLAPTCFGTGYWMVASDGGIFAFGSAPFLGSTGAIILNKPVVGMQVAIDHRFDQG